MVGHLIAAQIASQILTRDSEERRVLVLGLGLDLKDGGLEREGFFDVVDLAAKVL